MLYEVITNKETDAGSVAGIGLVSDRVATRQSTLQDVQRRLRQTGALAWNVDCPVVRKLPMRLLDSYNFV